MPVSASEILAKYKPARLTADTSGLSGDMRRALPRLNQAVQAMNRVYQRQLGDHVVELAERLAGRAESAEERAFHFYKNPYDRTAGWQPFMQGVAESPPGRALYPPGLTGAELDAYIKQHPDEREALLSPYTVVAEREGRLAAVPYHEHFAADLEPAVDALRAAAAEMEHAGLREFTASRAQALAGERDILESDADWVRLADTPLELIIGPYEVYDDGLRGVKAFYMGMLHQVDREACDRLSEIESALPQLAASFPVPAGAKPAMGGMAPLIVTDQLAASGDANSGILPTAFNLPNDPGVRGRVGWKQVMIRNVMQAKFSARTRPVAERVLSLEELPHFCFDAYFHQVLLHEVSHGLGPAWRSDGRSVNEACGAHHTALEEAKADTGGLVLQLGHAGSCGLPALTPEQIGYTYFSGLFLSARFGLHEAHGMANVLQFSYLKEQGAIVVRDGRARLEPDRLPRAASELLAELTRLQAAASPSELAAFTESYGRPPEELVSAVEGMADLPIDILPTFPLD